MLTYVFQIRASPPAGSPGSTAAKDGRRYGAGVKIRPEAKTGVFLFFPISPSLVT
jgi:hypothetical protein